MRPKHPKRLVFRKVRRPKPLPTGQVFRIHHGNSVADVSGCFLLTGVAFGHLSRSIQAAARQLATVRLVPPPMSYRCTVQLPAADVAALLKLVG